MDNRIGNQFNMMRKNIIFITLISVLSLPAHPQAQKTEKELKREVTLYNPYKPSLADVKKKSYLPEINDTTRFTPRFSYQVVSRPYSPSFTISPIKPASLLADPLPKLYKGYVKLGFGNYSTPVAELSVTNHRSKKGAIGLYARHYSSIGKVPLKGVPEKVFAGFMDNDATLFGKKFFRKSILGFSADYTQKTRYAYGYKAYDPEFLYIASKKEIKTGFYDVEATASFSSLNLDSADFSYDFRLSYDYFHNLNDRSICYASNHTGFSGNMAKSIETFYTGADLKIDHYKLNDSINLKTKYIVAVNPFVRKSTEQWNFNLGLKLILARNLEASAKFYVYPDIKFGFNIVPEYMRFFAELSGGLENNDPVNAFSANPFLFPDTLFRLPNTDHSIIVNAGLKGNSGMGGNYLVSVSYSHVNEMLLYANLAYPDTLPIIERGNYFVPMTDDAEILNIHGELSGAVSGRFGFYLSGNYNSYTLAFNKYAWNKPAWDGKLGFRYNLRDKILAGMEIDAVGKRYWALKPGMDKLLQAVEIEGGSLAHFNLNLNAEYRYSKILSFWVRVNNISYRRYYEWAFYPSQMFNIMAGFSYSL
jgi:hypothetical protein